MVLVSPFQHRIFYDSANLEVVSLKAEALNRQTVNESALLAAALGTGVTELHP